VDAVLQVALQDYPFYGARLEPGGEPAPWRLSDLEEFAAARPGDPFAGRVLAGSPDAKVALQIEATAEPPVWTALSPYELDSWVRVLARMWQRWGVVRGETIAFFDYGSSPLVLLASKGYVAYLGRGAAEQLGLAAVCNDGVASMAARMVSIIQTVRPSMLVLRRDVCSPLSAALKEAGTRLAGRIRWVAVGEAEGAPSRDEASRIAADMEVPVYRILRSDAAFVLAGECPRCGHFHLDRSYKAEVLASGEIAITTGFARLCPAVRSNIGRARLIEPGCPAEPRACRLACN